MAKFTTMKFSLMRVAMKTSMLIATIFFVTGGIEERKPPLPLLYSLYS